MMHFFSQWLMGIVGTALILAVFYAMLPAGKPRVVGRFAGSLVLLLVLLRPLAQWQPAWDLSYEKYAGQIREQILALEAANQKEMESIIAEEVSAYISSKGKQLGISCFPAVKTELRDGIPYPCQVTMDVPFHRELADYISVELGIPEAHQTWRER